MLRLSVYLATLVAVVPVFGHGNHGHHHGHHGDHEMDGEEGSGHHHSHDHLPLNLEEVDTSNPKPDRFHPFNPRFEVSRLEIDDGEWLNELASEFQGSGLLPSSSQDAGFYLLKALPSGIVNINYDILACVHMGTQLDAAETVYPPTAISYPTEEDSPYLHTLVLLDVDNGNRLHWLVVNIPGASVSEGQIVRGYNSPNPAPGTGPHRYVFMVMQQLGGRFDNVSSNPSDICKNDGRDRFNLDLFKSRHLLGEPFAVNYFTVQYDPFVENIVPVCHGPNTRAILV